ncbi:MAG: elongation factor G [Candidatus Omnitrophica bacterium]|nr:elongation factor G [Candidatus Omnitrophota bacterium]MDD5436825.1 elongation factor G [Candidatus Omnitrophota bacterium]
MASFEAKDIRNIILLGHSGSGKTTLVEALLYNSGAIPRMGRVDDGTTISDYNEDEKEKKHSASSSLASFQYSSKKINVIDIPGYTDFVGEMIGGLRAADACIVVVNATGGIEIGTERSYRMAMERGVPCIFFINMLDKEHSDYDKCFEDINKKFRKHCVAVDVPVGKESTLKDVVNIVNRKGLDTLSDSDKTHAKILADDLTEVVAETDDALLEKYLDKGELSLEELDKAFKKAVVKGDITPILCGSATNGIGIKELLDMIVNYLPSPVDRPAVDAIKANTSETTSLAVKADGPLAGLVFKTLSDPFLGQISIFKIFSGRLQSNGGFYNANKGVREKIGSLFTLLGKAQVSMEAVQAGDIGCVAKLKDTETGDSITDEKNPIRFGEIQFPEPAISFSLKPKTRADEDKISTAIHKISAEDPTFKVTRDEQTKEMIVSGMGDMHIAMLLNRMKMRYGVQVDVGTPKVAYKETIMGKGDAQYRHKKQSGGAGQFAEVWLRVEPLPRGTGFEFVDEVVGGAIPRPFVVSCEKGIRTALGSGPVAGFPVVDVRAIVYDGKTHPVDSKDIAFQTAARHAFKESILKAKPALLEPIMDVDIVVPDEFMGDITGSLNSRRGRVMGMEPADGSQVIKAKVPLEEMYKYVNELKSITGGRGTYTMTFSHYEMVPPNLAQVIAEKASKKEETED